MAEFKVKLTVGDNPDDRIKLHVCGFSKAPPPNPVEVDGPTPAKIMRMTENHNLQEPNSSDHVNQLKEKNHHLHEQLSQKDSQLLTKDRQIIELEMKISGLLKEIETPTKKEEKSELTHIDELDEDRLIQIFLDFSTDEKLEKEGVFVKLRDVRKKAWHKIRKLRFSKCGSTPTPDFIEKVLVRCGVYLNTLEFDDLCSSDMLEVISKYCINLTAIDLKFSRCNDEHAIALSKLAKLQSFTLRKAEPKFLMECLRSLPKTVEAMRLFSLSLAENLYFSSIFEKFDTLNCLTMVSCNLGIDLMEAVSNKQTITDLDLTSSNIEKGLNLLLNLSNLEYLDLKEVSSVDDNFLGCLSKKCLKLKYLDVSDCEKLSDRGIKELKNLNNLEELCINFLQNVVTDIPLGQFRGIKKLRCAASMGVKGEGVIKLIKNCPNLELLDVGGTSINRETLRSAVSMTKNRESSVILKLIADLDDLNFDVENEEHSSFLSISKKSWSD